MSVLGSNVLAGASGQAAEFQIERSLRFNSDDSAYLNKTFGSGGDVNTYTLSFWVKRGNHGSFQTIFSSATGNTSQPRTSWDFTDTDKLSIGFNPSGSSWLEVKTTRVFRDTAWYHIIVSVDTTQSTNTDKVKIYINGAREETFDTYDTLVDDLHTNSAVGHAIGRYQAGASNYLDGYLAEIHFLDGTSVTDATDFGEYDDNNVWQAKAYSGSYGTNGFYLPFSDATSTTTIAEDSSGTGNDFTANNISVTAGTGNDSLFDSPTNGTQSDTGAGGEVSGNYCTLSPIADGNYQNATISNGNLDASFTSNRMVISTIAVSSGKWYYEEHITSTPSNTGSTLVRAFENFTVNNTSFSWRANGQTQGLTGSPTLGTYTNGDVLGIAVDVDNTEVTFYKNGTEQGTGAYTYSTFGSNFLLFGAFSSGTADISFNFGQRAFTYQNAGTNRPANTFKALCTTHLPTPTIADGSSYFEPKLFTGTGSSLAVTSLAFSPDWIWIKDRTTANSHNVSDSVRGTNKSLFTNATNAETSGSPNPFLSSFDSNGFTVGGNPDVNTSGNSYVAWCWDAGSSTVSNTDGDITSSVRASQASGFSIVSYSGSGTSGDTVGHGLNKAPELILTKRRNATGYWPVYHIGLSSGQALQLDDDTDQFPGSQLYTSTAPTSSVFTVGDNPVVNTSGGTYISYCWTSVDQYSSFGTYSGNGDADGTFVFLGFRARYLVIKRYVDTGYNWNCYDTSRSSFNPANDVIRLNLGNAEEADYNPGKIDILSNGFKIRGTWANINQDGDSYIYWAFADKAFSLNGGLAR